MKPIAPPKQIGWAGHYLLLVGFIRRIYLVHTQFFEAKFNAFILTTKWFQQLQLREKIDTNWAHTTHNFQVSLRK